jgi:dihydrodiol dehydrogenase / D-xylose 1-dehydrogenase (NADP)
MTERMRWAILGTGKIANRFAAALNHIPERAELAGVGSRNRATADAFADKYHISKRYVGYDQVVADPDIDIVYIGTPGVMHQRDVTLCLEAGKPVLCEKVLAMNAGQTQTLIDLARCKKLFMMEAMWTRFFPIHVRIRELLAEGVIGSIRGIAINFCAMPPADPKNRFYDINLGAGVLLDTGSYGVSWAYSLLGEPEQVTGLASFGETGADLQGAYVLKYSTGQIVSIVCSQISCDVKEAVVFGPKGKIVVHDPWYKPTAMTVHIEGKAPQIVEMPLGEYNGYEFEAMAVMDCIQAGQTECPIMPLDESLSIVKILDRIRGQWGFKYPFEG